MRGGRESASVEEVDDIDSRGKVIGDWVVGNKAPDIDNFFGTAFLEDEFFLGWI